MKKIICTFILLMLVSISIAFVENNRSNPAYFEDEEVITELQTGWNLISTPIAINKTELYVYYNDSIYTFNESVSGQILLRFIYGWNRVNQQYFFAEILYPGEGYWIYAYCNCTLMKEIEMEIFGGHLPTEDYAPGGKYFQLMVTWGDSYANLCYCPEAGYSNSITAKLYGDAGTATAQVALIKPTVANIPPDAPYWERNALFPFMISTTSAEVIAVSELQSITNIGYGNEELYTFTYPYVSLTPGYYILVVCGCGNAPATGLGITGEAQLENTLNKAGRRDAAGDPQHLFPSNFTFTPDLVLNFPMNLDIYCSYQKYVIGLNMQGIMLFKNQQVATGGV